MNLNEHFEHQKTYHPQWIHARTMGAIAHLAKEVRHFDENAELVLTNENAAILGEYVLSLTEDGQRAAGFTIATDKSGCNGKVTHISYVGKKILMHFAGDRCNAPASPTNWCWK